MKRSVLFLGSCFVILCLLGYPSERVLALQASHTEIAQPASTITPTALPTPTPEPDVGVDVGANAGLLCGAVILVIIIVAGLMRSARWMPYRGRSGKDEGE